MLDFDPFARLCSPGHRSPTSDGEHEGFGGVADRQYRDHITELNSARPKQPFFFLKPTTSILLPGEGPVIRPRGIDLHYEVELALILGKRLKDLNAQDEQAALDAIESEFPKGGKGRNKTVKKPN